ILGISPDSFSSHQKFSAKYHLNFPILSDDTKEVIKRYGVWKKKQMFGRTYMGVVRTTFIIDEQGKISHIFPKVKIKGHGEKILQALSE
ncbi:MAG: redoxin domain-containing protein, partial [Bacteroidota bacterium]